MRTRGGVHGYPSYLPINRSCCAPQTEGTSYSIVREDKVHPSLKLACTRHILTTYICLCSTPHLLGSHGMHVGMSVAPMHTVQTLRMAANHPPVRTRTSTHTHANRQGGARREAEERGGTPPSFVEHQIGDRILATFVRPQQRRVACDWIVMRDHAHIIPPIGAP